MSILYSIKYDLVDFLEAHLNLTTKERDDEKNRIIRKFKAKRKKLIEELSQYEIATMPSLNSKNFNIEKNNISSNNTFGSLIKKCFHLVNYNPNKEKYHEQLLNDTMKLTTELKKIELFKKEYPQILELSNADKFKIEKDKNNVPFYICKVNEPRKSDYTFFIISPETVSPHQRGHRSFPYIEAEFKDDTVEIIELHSYEFENRGFATALLKTVLIEAALKYQNKPCTVKGSLSFVDAETEERKNHRNEFYRNKGFKINFWNDDEKNGSFRAKLSDLLEFNKIATEK